MPLTSDSADLEARSDLSGEASLGSAQDDVKEFLMVRHSLDLLPSSLHAGEANDGFNI
jgi:hypothetical protein